jgi:hypothetical protein
MHDTLLDARAHVSVVLPDFALYLYLSISGPLTITIPVDHRHTFQPFIAIPRLRLPSTIIHQLVLSLVPVDSYGAPPVRRDSRCALSTSCRCTTQTILMFYVKSWPRPTATCAAPMPSHYHDACSFVTIPLNFSWRCPSLSPAPACVIFSTRFRSTRSPVDDLMSLMSLFALPGLDPPAPSPRPSFLPLLPACFLSFATHVPTLLVLPLFCSFLAT